MYKSSSKNFLSEPQPNSEQKVDEMNVSPVCGKERMKIVKTFIFHNGALVDIAQLGNKGSPKIKLQGCST